MPSLRVTLFGRLSVRLDGRLLSGFDAGKVQELFSYLLLHRDRPHPRETLAGLLWGENSTANARKYLRQALWQLQSALDSQVEQPTGKLLLVENDWVHLDSGAGLWLDVSVFEQAYARIQGQPGQQMDSEKACAVEFAARIYEADLLEGWYQDWCLYERERYQNMHLAMLDKLMCYCEANQRHEMGLVWGEQILRYDRARERTHRQMMRLHYLMGDRTAGLRQYERCVTALDEELGVTPDRSTVALYEQLKAGSMNGNGALALKASASNGSESSSLPDVLNRLKSLGATLTDLQRQIQQDIRAVELSMNDRG
ncbi:MAG TPA: BTAD domain-containing putative transcriptional regulator [Blastocatellia bacterium]|nr:BTAD domain-containing putative transcriptional regulator [Blastocatellia bacterium]